MITSISRVFRFGSCLLIVLALSIWARPAHASGTPALLTRAIHDTDTVKTLQYTNQFVQTFSNGTVITAVQGQEDEARNRERDHETMVTHGKSKQGKIVTRAYVVNVVFLNGQTYYQHPLQSKLWHTKKGMTFKDGVASFKRGRTTVDFPGVHFTAAGTTPNGDAHFHARVNKSGVSGAVDVFVTKGKTPYVVLVNEFLTQHLRGSTVKIHARLAYGPFNQPLKITAPVSSTL